MRILISVLMLCFHFYMISTIAYCQSLPVTWTASIQQTGRSEAKLIISAKIKSQWHIYSQFLNDGGPQPTRIDINQNSRSSISGFEEGGTSFKYYDDVYEMDVTWFSNNVNYTASVITNDPLFKVSGVVEYTACNSEICIPSRWTFQVELEFTRTKVY